MLKMASESFIHALFIFLGLFSNLLVGCPRKVISDTASVHTYIKKDDLGAISVTESSSAVPISEVERHTSVPHFGVFCVLV